MSDAQYMQWKKEELKEDSCGIQPQLFWAGRMSIVAGQLVNCRPTEISRLIRLLDKCRIEYDATVFGKVKQ